MAFCSACILLVILGTQLKTITSLENQTANIAILFNTSDRYLVSVVQAAEELFFARQRKTSARQESITIYPSRLNSDRTRNNRVGVNNSLFYIRNLNCSMQFQGAVFVKVDSDSIFLSSIMDTLDVPTVGIFQLKPPPRTRVSLNNITY